MLSAAKLIHMLNELFPVGVLDRRAARSLLPVVRSKKIAWGILSSRTRSLGARMRATGLSAHKEIPRMPDAITGRRVAPRYPLILLAEVTDLLSSVKFTARTSDLRRTGGYIDMPSPLPRGTQVQVPLKNGGQVFESAAIGM